MMKGRFGKRKLLKMHTMKKMLALCSNVDNFR